MQEPHKFGFNFKKSDLYTQIPTSTIEVDSAITNLASFAKIFDVNYKILKLHNPWLRQGYLNNKSKRKYKIEIPKPKYYQK